MAGKNWRLSESERRRIIIELRNRGRDAVQLARKRVLEEKLVDSTARMALKKSASSWHNLAQSWLLSLASESVGRKTSITNRFATGLVFLGGGLDLHDDIIDKTLKKNGTTTCLGVYGSERTLLAGDYLIVKGLAYFSKMALTSLPRKLAIKVLGILEKAMIEMMDAESIELSFNRNLHASPDKYLEMVVKKSADVEAYFRIGAILGQANSVAEKSLGQFGRALGVLVILRDDISDLLDPMLAKSRLNNESIPLPVLLALRNSLIKSKVVRILKKPSYSKEDCRLLFDLVHKGGILKEMEATMMQFMKLAAAQLSQIKIGEPLETILKAVFPPFHVLKN